MFGLIGCGLLATGVLALIAGSEIHPKELVDAEAAYRQNDLKKALRLAKAYQGRRPSNRHAASLAAKCLSRLGWPDQAEIDYERALPLEIEDLHVRAYAFVINNRREPAIKAYHEILDRRPDDVLALSRLAGVLVSESRWDDALKVAERLIKIPAGAVIGHSLAGVVHHNTRDSELAVFAFARVLELDPDLLQMPLKPRSMFWSEYGHNLLVLGRCADARRCLQRALDDGNDPKVADLLGQSYYLEGAFEDAERWWRRSLEWDPTRFGTWWRVGKLELLRGHLVDAIEPLRQASKLEPRAVGPLYSLTHVYRRLGRREETDRLMAQLERLRGGATATPNEAADGSLIDTLEMSR
jgi:tetratricopeptide (TPR) repeat protein